MEHPENHLTAIMPDSEGRVWFTSKFGVVGMVLVDDEKGVCPPVYTTSIALFAEGAGAVENSVVAYEDHLIVGNTYGYVDPFVENQTAGGIERYDYNEAKGVYEKRKGWPAVGHLDGKTATPKLSTAGPTSFIGTYRGYVRFSSAPTLAEEPAKSETTASN